MTRACARLLPLLLLPVVALAACGGGGGSSASCKEVTAPPPETRNEPQPTAPLDTSKTYTVTFETSCGDFAVTLDPARSPNAASSFYSLAQQGFYDRTIFHRIVLDFLIQGGDPTQSGTDGPGYTTLDEPPPDTTYHQGTVAMAKSGADPAGTAGSQFFVVVTTDAGYAPDYAVVGTVSDGLDVVEEIGKQGDEDGKPTQVVEIDKATAAES